MSCERIEERLADYVSGHLDLESSAEVESHLESCDSCRSFHAQIGLLYQIPEPTGVTIAPPPNLAPYRWYQRPTLPRILSVASVVAVLVLVLHITTRFEPLPLPDITVTLPSYPEYPAPGPFTGTLEDAMLASRFTGMPVIEEFSAEVCPRCRHVTRLLELPERQEDLAGYITHRTEMTEDNAPKWVLDSKPDGRLLFMLPTMRVTDGIRATDPAFSIYQFETIHGLTKDWEESQSKLDGQKSYLSREQYDDTVSRLQSIPGLVAGRKYGEAVLALDAIVALDQSHRSEFIDVAIKLRGKILEPLEEVMDGELTGSTRQIEDLRNRLEPHLIGTPLASN